MTSHYVHDEEETHPSQDWEWVGPDGLTDSQRDASAEAWRQGVGRKLTSDEVNALQELAKSDMIPHVKLEELPS